MSQVINLNTVEQTQNSRQPRVDGVEAPRHRSSTPSNRCSYGDDVASMAWGVQNLMAAQVQKRNADTPRKTGEELGFIRRVKK